MNKKQTKEYQEKIKLKKDIMEARNNALASLQFLFDIGSKKTRAKYKGSNKDLSENKRQIIEYFLQEITSVVLLRHVCNGKKGLVASADKLMDELFMREAK